VKRTEISETLFENMKKRDDVIRNGGVAQTTTLPAIAPAPKKKALTQAPSPVRKLVNFDS
jgi:hypothetical protein